MINKRYIIVLFILMAFASCKKSNDQNDDTLLFWSSNNRGEIEF